MNSGRISLKDVRADVLGGHHAGNWDADFTVIASEVLRFRHA